MNPMRYAIVIDKTDNNYGAWAPDLPGCVAVGDTVEEVQQLMQEAIELHLAGMREDGDPIPPPVAQVQYVDVAA
jgi:predicted RNase H-like HicB family nuclease